MERTPTGTPVGVDDPFAHVDDCDHRTSDGRCRFAMERAEADPGFAAARRADDFRCPAADPEGSWRWRDCPNFRSTTELRECARCGLPERRVATADDRPLLQAHHLVYPDDDRREAAVSHELTVALCRWCHASVHGSWARVTDDAAPDPEALAALEGRRSDEQREFDFATAAERRGEAASDRGGDADGDG